MNRKDGGPAFPQHIFETRDGAMQASYDAPDGAGMSLRDYFAGQALVGMVQFWGNSSSPELAKRAYEVADAMLAEQERES